MKTNRASTLLLALWALFLLSAAVLTWARWIDRNLEAAHEANLALEARALARSGVTLALHPTVSAGSPLLKAETGYERSYEATLKGEGGKLNLGYLITGEDPTRIAILRDYLALRGLDLQERERFIDCLLDWTDPNNVRRLNGQEEGPDYQPTNRPLSSLEEIPLIAGSEALLSRHPDWEDDFTLLSQGPLDLEAAPAELIALIPGIGQERAEQFVRHRQGGDGIDHTDDDAVFADIGQVIAALGLTQEQFNAIRHLVAYHDPTVRVKSTGLAGKVHRQVEVVARRVEGRPPEILLWTEP